MINSTFWDGDNLVLVYYEPYIPSTLEDPGQAEVFEFTVGDLVVSQGHPDFNDYVEMAKSDLAI
jgi:hypothetical protein